MPAKETAMNSEQLQIKRLINGVSRINYSYTYQNPIRHMAEEICDLLDIRHAGFFLPDETAPGLYILVDGKGMLDELRMRVSFGCDGGLVQRLVLEGKRLTTGEMKKDPFLADDLETLGRLNAVVVIPMMEQRVLQGFMTVGARRSDEALRPDDLLLLETLATLCASIIRNVRAHIRVQEVYKYLLETFASVIESKDKAVKGHVQRTRRVALALAGEHGFTAGEKEEIELAAILLSAARGNRNLLTQVRPDQEPRIYRRLEQDLLWQKAVLDRILKIALDAHELAADPTRDRETVQSHVVAVAEAYNRELMERFQHGDKADRPAILEALKAWFTSEKSLEVIEKLAAPALKDAID